MAHDKQGRLRVTTKYDDALSGGLSDEVILAKATGSTDDLGKIGTIAVGETAYVCIPTEDALKADVLVSCNKVHSVQLYKAKTRPDSVTVTLSSLADGETAVVCGTTITGEATAADANFSGGEFSTAGATDTLDAAELAKLINADWSIIPDGSVAVGETLIIVTDEGRYVYTAAAAPVYADRVFDQSGNQAAELASIVLAINDRDSITCTSVAAGDKVTINGVVFTAKAGAAAAATHQFSKDTGNNETATSLAAVINDATYGIAEIVAVAAANKVSLYRATPDSLYVTDAASTLVFAAGGGVPGVIAAATGATGELALTPDWVESIAVTDTSAHIALTDIDFVGLEAVAAEAVVTLSPREVGDGCNVIYAVTGTAGAHCVVSHAATLLGLSPYGELAEDVPVNSTTAGAIYEAWVDGYPYLYVGVKNEDEAAAATIIVKANLLG